MSDILSSPCWMNATDYANPAFRRAYDLYVDERDQFGGYLMRKLLHISADDFKIVLVQPDDLPVFSPTGKSAPSPPTSAAATTAKAADGTEGEGHGKASAPSSSSSGFPYMAAVKFTVCPEVCDSPDRDGEVPCMVESAATALMDMITSFHIILANLPATNGHVSLSIQTNHMGKMECGKTYLGVSRVDKMGRRIVYSSVEYIEPTLPPVYKKASATKEEEGGDEAAPLPLGTTSELLTAMRTATVLANVKHVKSMLSFS